jgi:DNA-binding NarL/FixJ family response regulator
MSQNLSMSGTPRFLVVEDHSVSLDGTLNWLAQQYPSAEILTAQNAQTVWEQIEQKIFDLLVLDLSIPRNAKEEATVEVGLQLLRQLMKKYPQIHLTILTTNVKNLRRVRGEIETHQGGFTIADKMLSKEEVLRRVQWALEGVTHTKDIQGGNGQRLELKPEWYDVLTLAGHDCLQDEEIAKRMHVSPRTVRHYWTKIYDVLGIYERNGTNLRMQAVQRAREEGLI